MRSRDLVVLAGEAQRLTIPFDAQVSATAAAETLRVPPGGDIEVDGGEGDAVALPGALDAYRVEAGGNALTLTREADGTRAVIALNGPVGVRFDDGAATARIDTAGDTPTVTLGDVAVDSSFDPGAVTLAEPEADQPAGITGTNGVFLGGDPGARTLPFDANVTGTAARETVRVPAGADVSVTAGGGDRVALPEPLGAYSVSASGNELRLDTADSRVTVALNALTPIAFADGTATANIRVIEGDATVLLAGREVGPDGPLGPVAPDSPAISSLAGGFEPTAPTGLGASGNVFVAGQGPTRDLPARAETLTVGREAAGRVTVAAGGGMTLGADGGTALLVGTRTGADGRVDVRGADTRLDAGSANSTAVVGDAGTGTLAVRAGATAAMHTLFVGQAGTGVVRVVGEDSRLTLTPDGAGGFLSAGAPAGSRATIAVAQGGTVELTGTGGEGPIFLLGRDPGSFASLTVSGDDSAVRVTRETAPEGVGPTLTLGAGLGRATATVEQGGSVRVAGPATQLTVGAGDAAASTAPPTDTPAGPSELAVRAESEVVVAGPDDPASPGNAVVSIGAGRVADGSVTVSGPGARLSVEGATAPILLTGSQGQGSLTVADGGRVTSRFLLVADGNGTGRVTVEGTGSALDLVGVGGEGAGIFAGVGATAVIAGTGMGSMRVRDGGFVTIDAPDPVAPILTVARAAEAVGTLTVRGDGSRVRLDGPPPGGDQRALVTVGERGDGQLTVADGAEVVSGGAGAAVVARTPESVGRITVEGEGSRLETGGELLIGAGIAGGSGAVQPAQGGDGTVVVGDGGRLAAGTAASGPAGDVVVGASGTLRVAPGGAITGDVRVAGGTFVPGRGPAETPVDGDLDHAGAMMFELDGAAPEARDRLAVSGEVTLDGEVTIAVDPAFAPQPDDSFALVEAEGPVTLADTLDVRATGVPEGLTVELVGDSGTLFARFADDATTAG